jgi:hypothetical protein
MSLYCKLATCRQPFEAFRSQRSFCSTACRKEAQRSERNVSFHAEIPGLDEKQRARQMRQCREMLLEGYDNAAIIERFGDSVYDAVRLSLTRAEKAHRCNVAFNGNHRRRPSGDDHDGQRAEGV